MSTRVHLCPTLSSSTVVGIRYCRRLTRPYTLRIFRPLDRFWFCFISSMNYHQYVSCYQNEIYITKKVIMIFTYFPGFELTIWKYKIKNTILFGTSLANVKAMEFFSYFIPPNPPELRQWLRGALLFPTLLNYALPWEMRSWAEFEGFLQIKIPLVCTGLSVNPRCLRIKDNNGHWFWRLGSMNK